MASPLLTREVARAIYEYAGTEGLPDFDSLSPTVQISYIDEAEAAIKVISDYIFMLADGIDDLDKREQVMVIGTLNALILLIDPRSKTIDLPE